MKNRTNACNSFGEKLKVGMRNWRYGRTPFRSKPGCAFNLPPVLLDGEADGEALAVAGCGDACAVATSALMCCVCCGVFSPLNDGSCRKRSSQFGSTRAPSLVKRGGNRSLPSGV